MLAFLPQFVDPHRGFVTAQLLTLAVYLKTAGLVTGGSMTYGPSRIRRWFEANRWFGRVQEGILGVVMLRIRLSILGNRETIASLSTD